MRKIDFKDKMIIILVSDGETDISCWSKDTSVIDLMKKCNVGSLVQINQGTYIEKNKIVNVKNIELVGPQSVNNTFANSFQSVATGNNKTINSFANNSFQKAPLNSTANILTHQKDALSRVHPMETSIFIPIASLNSNISTWKIKAKIESKTDIKSWMSKDNRQMTKFSVILSDKSSKIEGVFWSDAAQRFHSFLEEGSV